MEKEGRQPEPGGIVDTKMYLLRYCFGKTPLLLTKKQVQVYCQMMAALGQIPYDIRPF